MQHGNKVNFSGLQISEKGRNPNPYKLAAMFSCPEPKTITDQKSCLGAINQLSCYIPDLSQHCLMLRDFLQNNSAFVWTENINYVLRRKKCTK